MSQAPAESEEEEKRKNEKESEKRSKESLTLRLEAGSLPHHEIEEFHMDEAKVDESCHPMTWSNCDATTFQVRIGPNYVSGQKAPSHSALYTVFAIDGYQSPKKVNALFQHVNLSKYIEESRRGAYHRTTNPLPPLVIINCMVPNYAPEMLSGKNDGDGYHIVLYARMSRQVEEELSELASGKRTELSPALRLFAGFIHANADSPLRQRFKCIIRVANTQHTTLSYVATSMVHRYNGKPFLARTSTTFYHSPGEYFAVDLDAHLFGYPARRGLASVKPSVQSLIYDAGFVVEGHTDNELPERILCCARISKIGADKAILFPLELIPSKDKKGKPLSPHSQSMPVIPRDHTSQSVEANGAPSREEGSNEKEPKTSPGGSSMSRLWGWIS